MKGDRTFRAVHAVPFDIQKQSTTMSSRESSGSACTVIRGGSVTIEFFYPSLFFSGIALARI